MIKLSKYGVFLFSFCYGILQANIPDYDFSYQDYLDFGQNKGKFKAGTTGLSITDKSGKVHLLDVPMPDFVGITDSQYGTFTFVGGSYVFSATHVVHSDPDYFIDNGGVYMLVGNRATAYEKGDSIFHRTDKFITTLKTPSSFLTDFEHLDASRYSAVYRSGKGIARYRSPSGKIQDITGPYEIRTGGRLAPSSLKFNANNKDGQIYVSRFESDGRGIPFSNVITQGDSGSPLLAYDTQTQQWVVLGAVSNSDMNNFIYYSIYREQLLKELISQYSNPAIHLNNQTLQWNNQSIGTHTALKNKDIFLKGGGTITLTKDIDQGYGGIYFDENQSYIINSKSNDPRVPALYWKGAGVSIGENTTVHWYLDGAPIDRFHKIGKGTLVVYQSQFVSNMYLNVGEGKVVLNTAKDHDPYSYAFRGIVIGSGRATIEVGKEGSLREDYLFFTRDGGTLDLNGTNANFNFILASDIGAKIINSDSTKLSKLTLNLQTKGLGSVNAGVFSNAFLYHGEIGDHIHIHKDTNGTPTNSNPSLNSPTTHSLLAFDGNIFNPHGKITYKNGNLTFQGHPVIHAYLSENLAEQVQKVTGDSVYTTPTQINQDDWEDRIFIFDHIDISQESESTILTLGRNATLLANIFASNAQIQFGGENAKIYIDKYDGENVQTNTVTSGSKIIPTTTFYQTLTAGVNQKDDSFYFEGSIQGKDSTHILISNTSSNPIKFGNFQGIDRIKGGYTRVSYDVSLDANSTFKAKYIHLYGNDQTIFDTLNIDTSTSNHSYATFHIQDLSLFGKDSKINANLSIAPFDNNNQSNIIFSSLQSTLYISGGTLTLSDQTQLIFDANTTDFSALHYNTPYPLIQSQNPIIDQRNNKDFELLNTDQLAFKPTTFSNTKQIGLIFKRSENITAMPNHDWFETYILNTINEKDSTLAEQKLQQVLGTLGDYSPIIKTIIQSNLQSPNPYQDILIDQYIIKASQGDSKPLSEFAKTHSQATQNIAQHAIIITDSLFAHTTSMIYAQNSRNILQSTLGFFSVPSQKLQPIVFLDLQPTQDHITPYDHILSSIIKDEKSLEHNLWLQAKGSYFSLQGSLFAGGLSAGYNYTLPSLSSRECYLSFALSFDYLYAQYQQTQTKEEAQAFVFGVHSLYAQNKNELIASLYVGNIWDKATISLLQTQNQTYITAFNLGVFYKYQFFIKDQEYLRQLIKPVVGLEYFYAQFPQGDFINSSTNLHLSYPKLTQNLPILNLGTEYNITTPQTINIFSLLFNYRFNLPQIREVTFDHIPLSPSPKTYFQEIWLKLAYDGSYALPKNLELNYSLLSEFSLKNPRLFGIQANLGVNWKF